MKETKTREGRYLRELRELKHLTQKEMGTFFGVSASEISAIETGRRDFTKWERARFLKIAGINNFNEYFDILTVRLV